MTMLSNNVMLTEKPVRADTCSLRTPVYCTLTKSRMTYLHCPLPLLITKQWLAHSANQIKPTLDRI